MFGNRVPRKIFGPNREEKTGNWWTLYSGELHVLYLPNVTEVVK
jgi:hypothetical protein